MGNLAILAKHAGYRVSGFDGPLYPPMSEQLANAGVEVFEGFSPSQLHPEPDLCIVGNADLPRGNAALEHVLNLRLPYTSGAEWLGTEILRDRHVIAVSGTHGKTTTTAMIASIMVKAGMNPGYLIGGVPKDLPNSVAFGDGTYFVIEADEYDTSYFDRRSKFLHYRPDTLIITSLEFDHADIFPDLEAIKFQFQHLIRAVPSTGNIILPNDHDTIEEVLERGCWTPISRYNVANTTKRKRANYWADVRSLDGSVFDVYDEQRGCLGTVSWNLIGEHNVANGLAALITVESLGIPMTDAIDLLGHFSGVKRRLEIIANNNWTTVYSDFAHHPTAIKTTLRGLRNRVNSDYILAVIDPSTHTMSTGVLKEALRGCCDDADESIWFRSAKTNWDLDELSDGSLVPTRVESSLDRLVEEICQERTKPTHVVIMSNGSFHGIFGRICRRIL